MAFVPYVQGSVSSPHIDTIYAGLKEHVDATRGLMSALGTFWSDSFGNMTRSQTAYETMVHATTGCVLPLSDAYRSLLTATLEASIQSIPELSDRQLELVVFSESRDADGNPVEPSILYEDDETDEYGNPMAKAYVFHGTPFLDVDYFTVSLFNSVIVLEKGTHFDIDGTTGDLTFYVDIFEDPAIIQDAYGEFALEYSNVKRPSRSIMLWAVNAVQQSFRIWERFGAFVYRKAADSPKYKHLINALMYYYANMKTPENVEHVMNIIYGVPYAWHDGEVVQAIYEVGHDLSPATVTGEDSDYHCIETLDNGRLRRYYCYGMATLSVSVGDVLSQYQVMGKLNEVYDYIQIERMPEKFIPATAHPESMTRSEQIQYVYEHWNDADGTSFVDDDSIDVSPDLRADIIRYVLKYNSLFVRQYISLDAIDTYKNQIEQMRNVLRSGLPIYLNPMLETIFKLRLVDRIPTDEEIKQRIAEAQEHADAAATERDKKLWENEKARWETWTDSNPAVLDGGNRAELGIAFDDAHVQEVLYDGTQTYNGGACYDHDSVKDDFALPYDGTAAYDGIYAHHAAQSYGSLKYDGKQTYGNCFQLAHQYDEDEFAFTGMSIELDDAFTYSEYDGSFNQLITYNGAHWHDGRNFYGWNNVVPGDLQVSVVQRFSDRPDELRDMFSLTVTQRDGRPVLLHVEDLHGGMSDAFKCVPRSEDFAEEIPLSDDFSLAMRMRDSDITVALSEKLAITAARSDTDSLQEAQDELIISE